MAGGVTGASWVASGVGAAAGGSGDVKVSVDNEKKLCTSGAGASGSKYDLPGCSELYARGLMQCRIMRVRGVCIF